MVDFNLMNQHIDNGFQLQACQLMSHFGEQVHNMTIRAKGKLLLENAHLSITAGRRYGLVGPNGKGKSTLLRMVARRQIPVPENLDVLLVEQVWHRLLTRTRFFESKVNNIVSFQRA